MKQAARNTWMAASLALALGSGEVAYQGLAPRARDLLESDPSRAAIRAGQIVLGHLCGLAIDRAREAAAAIALHGVRQTSRLYRMAESAIEATEQGSVGPIPSPAEAETGGSRPRHRVRAHHDAVIAIEMDSRPAACKACGVAGASCREAGRTAALYSRRTASRRSPFRMTTTVLPSWPETATGSFKAPKGVSCPKKTSATSTTITPEAITTF